MRLAEEIRATVISDASFGQPSKKKRMSNPNVNGKGGWAAWVRIDGVDKPVRGYGVIKAEKLQNSTMAEVYAAMNGIFLAKKYGANKFLVRSDCMAVQHLIDLQARSPLLLKIWNDGLVVMGVQHDQIVSRWVKGHGVIKDAATFVNNWCDRHARIGLESARKGQHCLEIL